MPNLQDLEQRIAKIEARNQKVELEKRWETSIYRKLLVLFFTYLVMMFTMLRLGVKDFYLQAIIPTLGYFLSTLSFNFLKKYYIKKF